MQRQNAIFPQDGDDIDDALLDEEEPANGAHESAMGQLDGEPPLDEDYDEGQNDPVEEEHTEEAQTNEDVGSVFGVFKRVVPKGVVTTRLV